MCIAYESSNRGRDKEQTKRIKAVPDRGPWTCCSLGWGGGAGIRLLQYLILEHKIVHLALL